MKTGMEGELTRPRMATQLSVLLLFGLLFTSCFLSVSSRFTRHVKSGEDFLRLEPDNPLRHYRQDWDYVDVRPQAHMFYWLFYTTHAQGHAQRPLIMWLQGGPGASSTGVGNFQLIGPLDVHLQPRNTTWLQEASLLFVDQPVGTGFSYVDDDSAHTTDGEEIANDLLVMMYQFYKKNPEFRSSPFYIFGQSYGGKMAALFAKALQKAIGDGEIECNFAGFAMGNAWISPIDSTMTWAGTLHWAGVVDDVGYSNIQDAANHVKVAYESGAPSEETMEAWFAAQRMTHKMAAGVDFYNIDMFAVGASRKRGVSNDSPEGMFPVIPGYSDADTLMEADSPEGMFPVLPGDSDDDDLLDALMNTEVRQHVGIIPAAQEWNLISWKVFRHQYGDFMNPVYNLVGELLETSDLDIVVYQGQLDLICDTKGAMEWVQKLPWTGLQKYNNQTRITILHPETRKPEGFLKKYRNFSFYTLLDAGHHVPSDQRETSLHMLKDIVNN